MNQCQSCLPFENFILFCHFRELYLYIDLRHDSYNSQVSHMYRKKISGPLFNKTPIRTKVWRWHEKLKFTLGFHWLEIIFSDYWNLMDFFMIILFVVGMA